METHPNLNDPVVLRDGADREYLSRVEDLAVGLVVVARPLDLPADEAFDPGTEMNLVWVDGTGVSTVLPARILAAHAEGSLQLWSLAATGPAFREQRRRFVRVPASGPVVLWPAADAEADPIEGTLLDVSEAAVRCTVGAGAADRFLTSADPVVAEFRFGTEDFAVPGRVEFLRPTAHPAEFEQLVVVFDEPVAEADALRKQVFEAERRTLQARNER